MLFGKFSMALGCARSCWNADSITCIHGNHIMLFSCLKTTFRMRKTKLNVTRRDFKAQAAFTLKKQNADWLQILSLNIEIVNTQQH
jgi:hypothetical protein